MPFGDYSGPHKPMELKPGAFEETIVYMASFKVEGDIKFPVSVERQNVELLRFVKRVADYSNDARLARAADELITLYGDPDAPKPRGTISP